MALAAAQSASVRATVVVVDEPVVVVVLSEPAGLGETRMLRGPRLVREIVGFLVIFVIGGDFPIGDRRDVFGHPIGDPLEESVLLLNDRTP